MNKKIVCIILALFTVLAFSTANQPITREEALEVINTGSTLIINIVKFGLNYEKAYGVKLEDNTALLEGVVSRKKQVVPVMTENA